MNKVKGFFHGVKKEVSRIHWPNKKILVNYSLVCVLLIIFFGVYFYGLDALFAFLKGVIK